MEVTYDNIVKWFNVYYQDFDKYSGPYETFRNMEKYFTPDLEFWPYIMPNTTKPTSREGLLMTMVHPGLHEELTPKEYIVDLNRMVVVVLFQLQFTDAPSGRVWPAQLASCHYHLALDKKKELKIKKIVYFTSRTAPEESKGQEEMMALWAKYREKALKDHGKK